MINPVGMSLRDWADSLILTTNASWSFGRLDDEEHWQAWGAEFRNANPFSTQQVPDPYAFSTWQEWAMRSYLMLETT